MTRILIICFLLISQAGFSQTYINKSKRQVRKELDTYITKYDNLNATINETDTSITLAVKGPATLPANFIYRFDKKENCISEKTITYCDSCYTKYLQAALDRKKYGWKKINGNQYVSDFASQMLIELPVDKTDLSFLILRTAWSKQMYDILKGQ